MATDEAFAAPRFVDDIRDCDFYHTMDLPGFGVVSGQWDLRAGVREYLGSTELDGKRVLDVGTASGFLAFWMERAGARVVGYDLSELDDWDVVPFASVDVAADRTARKGQIRRVNNSFWLAHRLLKSSVRVAYGSVYHIPEGIGRFDVAVFGSILLHLRDPFLALERALRLTGETAIVADVVPRRALLVPPLARWIGPSMDFLPDARTCAPRDSWWRPTPAAVVRMLGVLGFANCTVTYHTQRYTGKATRLYTVVGRRTAHSEEPLGQRP